MRDPSDITPFQADILEILWAAKSATAADVRAALGDGDTHARTTVATMLSRMERYGWLTRHREGRELTYRTAITRSRVRRAQVRRMVRALFPDDVPSLVSHALREGDWAEEDLDRIDELVRQHRQRREEA